MKKLLIAFLLLLSAAAEAQYVVGIPTTETISNGQYIKRSEGAWRPVAVSQIKTDLSLIIADISGLQAALDAKAAAAHTHGQSDITGLASSLAAKQNVLVSGTSIKTVNLTSLLGSGNIDVAAATHSHAISEVTGLQAALDGKQPLDVDLTAIAGLTPTTDNFMVAFASAWASRTPAQVKTTLSLNNVENTALSTWPGSTSITTLGTISSGTVPLGNIGGLGAGVSSFLSTSSSANLASALTDETGSGALAFSTSPTFSEPIISQSATFPSTPGSAAKVFSYLFSGRQMLAQVGQNPGTLYAYQPLLGRGKISIISYHGASANSGNLAINATGTALGSVDVATTNLFKSIRRATLSSTTSAGTTADTRHNGLHWFLGSSTGMGGFFVTFQCGISAAVADGRGFVGLYGSLSAIGNVNPTTLTDIIGFAFNNGGADWKVMHNDASGTATSVSLGSAGDAPSNTNGVDWYQFTLYAPSGQSSAVYYHVRRVNTDAEWTGTLTTNLPAANTRMTYHIASNNGATGAAEILDVSTVYIETEN